MVDIGSVCTYCGVGCDITAKVKDNKIEKIYAQTDGHVSRGKLCIKGKNGYHFVHSEDRLKDVMIKKSFIKDNFEAMPRELKARSHTLQLIDDVWFKSSYEFATSLVAWKLSEIKYQYGEDSFFATGGARTSCESAYTLQKFTRQTMQSANIDNCARVCHSPSLSGMKKVIGEGAATNPYDDIFHSEFILVMGSNTTEAHPIVANRILEAVRKKSCKLAVLDVRHIQLHKYSDYDDIIPYEANLLILNMLAYVIIKEKLYDQEFIKTRTKEFEIYKKSILEDKYANPEFFRQVKGYESLANSLPKIAKDYAISKSMIFWGLGITEHLDGSYAVMALANLAILTGNIGKQGAGLMPLRGQNNVQGACDMGCLPYYDPDYEQPKKVGLTTTDAIDAMVDNKIKSLYVMGEDLTHIHPNQNKIKKAIENLDLIVVQDLFLNDIAQKAHIVFGVKSAYEKTGVYVNAMRRLHLSQPLVNSDLPDDWEVLRDIENKIKGEFLYNDSNDVWEEVRVNAPKRFAGASYIKLTKNRSRGMQWPISKNDTPILHIDSFRTDDGLAVFQYNQYKLREQIEKLVTNVSDDKFYLTTGRTIVQYNNSAQTNKSETLNKKYPQDVVQISIEDQDKIKSDKVILKSAYGQTTPLPIKFVKTLKKGTLFCTFHHKISHINHLFGDECDELVQTARFKSVEVVIEQV